MTVKGDNPITGAYQDDLRRNKIAKHFASQVLSLDASEGAVVGVLGPWGSGKTSFINLALPDIERSCATVLKFNPWIFSGADQLVESFFNEVSAQLKLKKGFDEIAGRISDYGELFAGITAIPVVGSWLGLGVGFAKGLKKLADSKKQGFDKRRAAVFRALEEIRNPIVVIVDDIDRLATEEIRDIFKLVRLTASFPNVIYVLAFDRYRVELALADQGVSGREYMEKILQVAVDIPEVSPDLLYKQFFKAIDAATSDITNPGELNKDTWPNVFFEVIAPLVKNMRDVRRLVASSRGTIVSLEGQITLGDVLALEAVRLFLPDVFLLLSRSIGGLTEFGGEKHDSGKDQIDRLVAADGSNKKVVNALLKRLFPAAGKYTGGMNYDESWAKKHLKNRAVAHVELLNLYLQKVPGESLVAFNEAEVAWKVISDSGKFYKHLISLDRDSLEKTIASLESYEEDFNEDHARSAIPVLLNIIKYIPERPRGMFEFDAEMVVSRVVFRLLRSSGDSAAVEKVVEKVLPKLDTLTSKLRLITSVGYRQGAGHELISLEAAEKFQTMLDAEVRAASLEDLKQETDLTRLFFEVNRRSVPAENRLPVPDDAQITYSFVKSAMRESKSQSGDGPLKREGRLEWDILADIFGGEVNLKDRIDAFDDSSQSFEPKPISLAKKYASGWRPKEFGDC